jgi:hypothetical protein
MAVVPGLLCQSHNASCHKAVERTPMSSNQFQKPAPAEAERVTYLARLDFSNQNFWSFAPAHRSPANRVLAHRITEAVGDGAR